MGKTTDKTGKIYKRVANYSERQRFKFVLKFLKEEKYIPSYGVYLAKYGLRKNYINDLKREFVSMSIDSAVFQTCNDYPIIRKEWVRYGTGKMLSLKYRHQQALEEDNRYTRWENEAAQLQRDLTKSFLPLLPEMEAEEIAPQKNDALVEYLIEQLKARDTRITELENMINDLKNKAVED